MCSSVVDTDYLIAMWTTRVIVFIVLNTILLVSSKRYETRCKLGRELVRVGVPVNSLFGQWVCLIEKVSNRDTATFVVTPSGKKFYGLYQIPSRWCREGKRGGECNVACESLLDDDIRDDTACAVLIFNREGFKYWSQWTMRCKNDYLITNEIFKCPDLISPRSSPDRMTTSELLRHRRTIAAKSLARSGLKALRVPR